MEDLEQYDISVILKANILEEDLKTDPGQKKIVSKIIYSDGKYFKTYCHGFLNNEGELIIKISAVCDDQTIEIIEE